jgi:hypothetical protein
VAGMQVARVLLAFTRASAARNTLACRWYSFEEVLLTGAKSRPIAFKRVDLPGA